MTENPRWPNDHPARTHCWRCGKRITSGERYHTLTVPFGPAFGVEHETCPLAIFNQGIDHVDRFGGLATPDITALPPRGDP